MADEIKDGMEGWAPERRLQMQRIITMAIGVFTVMHNGMLDAAFVPKLEQDAVFAKGFLAVSEQFRQLWDDPIKANNDIEQLAKFLGFKVSFQYAEQTLDPKKMN